MKGTHDPAGTAAASVALPGNGELVPLGEGPVAKVLAGADGHGAFALKAYPGPIDRRTRGLLDAELHRLGELRARAPVLVADRVEELPDGRCALRMELCAQSLSELVGSSGPLSVPDALAVGSTLAATLAAAHATGLVHGGVTPGNVLFRSSGEPVLGDFGLTLRHAFPGEMTTGVDFLAPETVRDGTRNERTDLYGLGAVLYFALAGSPPHQGQPGEQVDERLLRTLSGEVPVLDRTDLPPGLSQLVSALLASNPDARPLDAATVAARLGPPRAQPVFDDFGDVFASHVARPQPSAPPAPPLPRGGTRYRARRKPKAGVVLAIVGALSVLAVAMVLVLHRPAKPGAPISPAAVAAPEPGPPSGQTVLLELADPVDQGNYVELSWRSSEPLDFAVVIAPEGQKAHSAFVARASTYRVRIDPVLRYCFLIQGATSTGYVQSQPKPIRGATCVNA
ncbi:serine/threonine protein kinase [Amycolatopsis albispora]|uniref:non-specific serine/threonine protein kinase n=1 Tax=Amycolatopsis albispora TaxID=1804986 RepID=A0A344L5B0_9PSEU|nr:protein kinase [Amycolatopsis albispora]AXB43234.1 protein kinase [Amycolatopsis albispora]